MSEDTQQAVVEKPNVAAQPATEATSARDTTDDLDSLLNEFQDKPTLADKPQPELKTETDKSTKTDDGAFAALEQVQSFIFRQDMQKTIATVRGELDPETFDEPLVEAWIDAQARQDPRLKTAWVNRHASPKQFERVVQGLARNFAKKFSRLPDRNATEDRAAVTAAVRGASTKAPEGKAPDFKEMSDAEFNESVKKEYGFRPL